jgi:hypothetical protein
MKTAVELIQAYSNAYEAVGGHPNRSARALGLAAVIELLADDVELGGLAPLPPSIYAALLREKAENLRALGQGAGVDRDGPE